MIKFNLNCSTKNKTKFTKQTLKNNKIRIIVIKLIIKANFNRLKKFNKMISTEL